MIAKKAGVSMAQVIAIWGHLLEAASMSEDRGNPGVPDFESMDFYLEVEEGVAQRVYGLMQDKGLISKETGRLVAWERRQPKREREDEGGAERKRRQRERETGNAATGGEASRSRRGLPIAAPTAEGENETQRTTSDATASAEREARISTKVAAVCKAIRAKGVTDVTPSDPKLRELVEAGVGVEIFEQAAEVCVKASPPKGMAYLLAIVTRLVREAREIGQSPDFSDVAWDQTRSGIDAKACALGLTAWDEAAFSVGQGESYLAFTARVKRAAEKAAETECA
ncbi:hypothetical protein [Variovorax sp. R-27]|uniref:hypothetical protein n=1 Tax=Variovorax sp. R-27 TaxID=3404058 RepID=UPI003CEE44E2